MNRTGTLVFIQKKKISILLNKHLNLRLSLMTDEYQPIDCEIVVKLVDTKD